MMRFDEYYDVVIVGTGAAGLYCALNFPKRYKVLLLTKQKADECDSFLAERRGLWAESLFKKRIVELSRWSISPESSKGKRGARR